MLWAGGGAIHHNSLPLSFVVVSVNVILSRLLTPHSIAATDDGSQSSHYLNLNLAYELWPDIKVPLLLIWEDRIPYLVRLLLAWWFFNAVVFVFLCILSVQILGPTLQC